MCITPRKTSRNTKSKATSPIISRRIKAARSNISAARAKREASVLHHRSLQPKPRGIGRTVARGRDCSRRGYPDDPEVESQSAVQRGHAAGIPGGLSDFL